jgi:hypothetical protein
MTGDKRGPPERVSIQVGATFDSAEAERIRALLRTSAPASVALDFAEVRHFEDAALCELARELWEATRPVALRGIPVTHYRMLRST